MGRDALEGQSRPGMSLADDVQQAIGLLPSGGIHIHNRAWAAGVDRTNGMLGRTRLYVAHQQLIVAESLHIALGQEPDIEIVGVQTTMDLVEHRVLHSGASVLLLDASIDVTRLTSILSTVSTAGVRSIVLTQDHDPDLLRRCVSAGAVGYLVEPQALPDLISAIRHAQYAWVVLTPEQVTSLIEQAPWRSTSARAAEICSRLSPRERDVLQILVTGATTDEIAGRLLISANTVQSHLKNAMRKLNVRSKLAAAVLALSAGVIEAPDE